MHPATRPARSSNRLALQAKKTRDSFHMQALIGQPAAQTQEVRRLTGLLADAGMQAEQTKAALIPVGAEPAAP
ncbi:hypothetical protein [Nonomuraea sp. bgisy101]|uniref:hypothetical protein n=1 Tax=Nonomuraea sp. bgisy101 TaxID=3413784 RepID=UPI003D761C62